MKAFSQLNPVVELTYFIFTIGFSVFIMNPVCLAISLVCSLLCAASVCGVMRALRNILLMLPMMIIAALLNPAFNHEGVTILTYLPGGNPLTLESIAYGFGAGAMIAAVICHFSSFNEVMTSDKLTYILGRISPSVSLIFSMTLRLVPRFVTQFKRVSTAQKGIGRDISRGGFVSRIKNGAKICAIMINWALENGIETADSMKSRGYGLKCRTAFSMYAFDNRDRCTMASILLCAAYIICTYFSGDISYTYFPQLTALNGNIRTIGAYTVYAVMMLMPVIINEATEMYYKIKISGIKEK